MVENPNEHEPVSVLRELRDSLWRRRQPLTPGRAAVLDNFLSLSFLQSANYLFPLITLPYLLRVVGYEKYGLIAFAQSLVMYFITLTDYGFNLSATRDISLHKDNRDKISQIFFSVMLIKIVLMIVGFVAFCVLVFTVTEFAQNWVLYFFTFGIVLGRVLFPVWFFQGIEEMKYITVATFVEKLIFTLLLFILIRRSSQYLYVPLLISIGAFVSGVVGLTVALRKIQQNWILPQRNEVVAQLKGGWHVFISTVSINAYTATRVFAVGLFTTPAITGAYALAEKLMGIIQTFPLASLQQAVYPRLSALYATSRTRSYRLMLSLQRFTTLAYLIVLPFIFVAAPFVIRVVAGSNSLEATLAFRLLIAAVFFINANAFRAQFLLVSGRDAVFSRIHLLAGGAGIVLVFVGTYLWSYVGPAIAIIAVSVLVYFLTPVEAPTELVEAKS